MKGARSLRIFLLGLCIAFSVAITLPHHTYAIDPANMDPLAQGGQQTGNAPDRSGALSAGVCNILTYNSLGIPNSFDFECVWISIMAWLGSWFLTIGGTILLVAGWLFDFFIQNMLINFSGTITSLGILGAITTGWTIIRDIANIVIIGMFVFMAIATILGIDNYGYKQMIARVLVIAILINFSLLFCKLAIDASNFTAYQFYLASQKGQSVGQGGKFDMAQAFLAPMGITSIWHDSGQTAMQLGSQVGGMKGGFIAFAFGLIGGLLLTGAAFVLLYGSFLIASRSIILIVLMLTASLAFASHLMPWLNKTKIGWGAWWQALASTSVFAPILMIMLYISLTIVRAAGDKTAQLAQAGSSFGGTINSMIQPGSDPASAGGSILLIYVLGIGVLFASFKIASTLASQSSTMLAAGASGTLLATAGRAGGFFGRQTLGRWGVSRAQNLEKQKVSAVESGDSAKAAQIARRLENSNKRGIASLGKRDFNFANTSLGKALTKGSLVSGQTNLGGQAGIQKTQKDTAEKAAKEAVERLKPATAGAQKAVGEYREGKTELTEERRALSEQANVMKDMVKNQREALEEQKKMGESTLKQLEKERITIEKQHNDSIADIEKKIGAEQDPDKKSAFETERETMRSRHQEELRAQGDKISTVHTQIQNLERDIATVNQPHKDALDLVAKKEADIKAHDQAYADKLAKAQQIGQTAAEAAKILGTAIAQPTWKQLLRVPAPEATVKTVTETVNKNAKDLMPKLNRSEGRLITQLQQTRTK